MRIDTHTKIAVQTSSRSDRLSSLGHQVANYSYRLTDC